MNFRKYIQKNSIVGACSAFAIATTMALPSFAGSTYLEIFGVNDISIYTDGGTLPASIGIHVQGEVSRFNTPDIESVSASADGGAAADGTLDDDGDWFANVSVSPDANPFTSTITAIGSVPAYYQSAAYTVTDSVMITLTAVDTSTIDSNDDGEQ